MTKKTSTAMTCSTCVTRGARIFGLTAEACLAVFPFKDGIDGPNMASALRTSVFVTVQFRIPESNISIVAADDAWAKLSIS